MTHEQTLACARVIQQCAESQLDVLDIRHEVLWPDGTLVHLHPVRRAGALSAELRAFHYGGRWIAFSLAHVAPRIALDLKTAPLRDQPGTVLYGLRAAFVNAEAFRARVARHELAAWPGADRAIEHAAATADAPTPMTSLRRSGQTLRQRRNATEARSAHA